MKRQIVITFFGMILCGCTATYNITTESDLQQSEQNMMDISQTHGYTLQHHQSTDTIYWNGYDHRYNHPYYWTIEEYQFYNNSDSVTVNISYRHRCITEAQTIPYIDNCCVECKGNKQICDTITKTMTNLPTTKTSTITEGSLSGLIILLASIPTISLLLYSALINKQ